MSVTSVPSVFSIVILAVFMVLVVSCQDDAYDQKDIQPILTRLEIDRYTDVEAVSHQTVSWSEEWEQYFFDTEDCRCVLGNEFSVFVKPGTSNSLLLYLDGGGACWPPDYIDSCSTKVSSSGAELLHEVDLLPTWNRLFVPYCDGSVHMGDNDADYDGDGVVDHYHWGLKNVSGAIALMKQLFPNPDEIVLGGSSGGGYGTLLAFAVLRSQYPDVEVTIYNDAGPGMFNPYKPEVYETIKETWQHMQFMPEECPLCQDQITYLYDFYLEYDPHVTIGMFSAYQDFVIATYFLRMSGPDFEDELLNITDYFHSRYPNRFKRYFVEGIYHTAFDYGLDNNVRNNISVVDWFYAMVEDSSEWTDVLE